MRRWLVPISSNAVAKGVGFATGLAVVGDLIESGAAREEAVVGKTPNLAARLHALANPTPLSSPKPPEAVARSASLDASAAVNQP